MANDNSESQQGLDSGYRPPLVESRDVIHRQVLGLSQDSWEELDYEMSIAPGLPSGSDDNRMDIDGESVKEAVQNGQEQKHDITRISSEQSDYDQNGDSQPELNNDPPAISNDTPHKQPTTPKTLSNGLEDSRSSSEKKAAAEMQEIVENGSPTDPSNLSPSVLQDRTNRLNTAANGQLRARNATPHGVAQASARLGNVMRLAYSPFSNTFATGIYSGRIPQPPNLASHALLGYNHTPTRVQSSLHNADPAQFQQLRNGSSPNTPARREAVARAMQQQNRNAANSSSPNTPDRTAARNMMQEEFRKAAQGSRSSLFPSTGVRVPRRDIANSIGRQLDFVQESVANGSAHVNAPKANTVSDHDSEPEGYEGYGPNGEFLDLADPPVNNKVRDLNRRHTERLARGALARASGFTLNLPRPQPTSQAYRTIDQLSSVPWPHELPMPFSSAAEIIPSPHPILDETKARILTFAKRGKYKELSPEEGKVYLDKEWRRYRERLLKNGKEAIDILTDTELLGADANLLKQSVEEASRVVNGCFVIIYKNQIPELNLGFLRDICTKIFKRQQKLETQGNSLASSKEEDKSRARGHYICEEDYDWVCKQLDSNKEDAGDNANGEQTASAGSPEIKEPDRFHDNRDIDEQIRRVARAIGGYDAKNTTISMLETQKTMRQRRKFAAMRQFSGERAEKKESKKRAREEKKTSTPRKKAKAVIREPSPEDGDAGAMAVDHAVDDDDAMPDVDTESAIEGATEDDGPEETPDETPDDPIDEDMESEASSEDIDDESLQFTISIATTGMGDLGYIDNEYRTVSIIKAKSSRSHIAQTIADDEAERVVTNYRYFYELPRSRVDLHTTSANVGAGEYYLKTVALHVDKYFKANIITKVTSKSIMTQNIVAVATPGVAALFEKHTRLANGEWKFVERSDILSVRRTQSSVHASWSARDMLVEWARAHSWGDEEVIAGVRARVEEEIEVARVLERPYDGEKLFWEHEEILGPAKMRVWVQKY